MQYTLKTLGIVLFIVSFIGCSKDSDSGPDGVTRNDFLGTYNCFQTCDGPYGLQEETYEVEILAGSEDDEIIITDFFDSPGAQTKATVDGNKLMINYPGTYSLIGDGELDGKILTISFISKLEFYGTYDCTVVCTKQ